MSSFRLFHRSLVVFFLLPFVSILVAQESNNKDFFSPKSGQEGKDVIWVPTPQILVDKMLDIAKVTPEDYVIDLGSGDGRLVITAAKRGARALGIEYNPEMVELSTRNAAKEGVTSNATFMKADIFETDFSEATVITLFLMTDLNVRLRPKLLALKPGSRIVSNTFSMEDWEADETVLISEDCNSWCKALLWIIPAKVEGTWKLDNGELTLKQEFQKVYGKLNTGRNSVSITEGRLNGTQITFKAGGARYEGIVTGKKIQGTCFSKDESTKWIATQL